jgi:hypothetical protein
MTNIKRKKLERINERMEGTREYELSMVLLCYDEELI